MLCSVKGDPLLYITTIERFGRIRGEQKWKGFMMNVDVDAS